MSFSSESGFIKERKVDRLTRRLLRAEKDDSDFIITEELGPTDQSQLSRFKVVIFNLCSSRRMVVVAGPVKCTVLNLRYCP